MLPHHYAPLMAATSHQITTSAAARSALDFPNAFFLTLCCHYAPRQSDHQVWRWRHLTIWTTAATNRQLLAALLGKCQDQFLLCMPVQTHAMILFLLDLDLHDCSTCQSIRILTDSQLQIWCLSESAARQSDSTCCTIWTICATASSQSCVSMVSQCTVQRLGGIK